MGISVHYTSDEVWEVLDYYRDGNFELNDYLEDIMKIMHRDNKHSIDLSGNHMKEFVKFRELMSALKDKEHK